MRRSLLELYEADNHRPAEQTVLRGLEDVAERCVGGPLSEPQRGYIFCPDFIAWFTGPYGSGKTSALVASLMMPSMLYPDSHWFLARAVYWTLEETTLKELDDVIDRIGPNIVIDRVKGPPYKLWIKPAVQLKDFDVTPPSKITVHSLDDMGKLGSTRFSGIGVDEADEVDENIITALPGRLRHKRKCEPKRTLPDGKPDTRPQGPFFLRMSSNPPRRSHFLHRKFCTDEDTDPVKMGTKFGSTRADNEHNLPEGYYEKMTAGMSPSQKLRYAEGLCGPDPSGDGVFSDDFNNEIHAAPCVYDPTYPLIRGWDFGRRGPSVVWAQPKAGQVVRLACTIGKNISLYAFSERVLNQTAVMFPRPASQLDYVDPHGDAKRDVSEKTSVSILREKRLSPQWRDVSVETGIELMTKWLHTMVPAPGGSKPKSQFDRVRCNALIEGYMSGYCYPPGTKNQPHKPKPLADGYYEHVMDADRYIVVNMEMGSTVKVEEHRRVLRRVRNPLTGY